MITWSSSDPTILEIDQNGLATAKQLGTVTIRASYNNGSTLLTDSVQVSVGTTTVGGTMTKSGVIMTTSSYVLTGTFDLVEDGSNLQLNILGDYQASTALPGLYLYLSNNRNSIANAYEVGAVQVFSGAHSYTINNTGINDYDFLVYYCKPFNVKVGDGEIN